MVGRGPGVSAGWLVGGQGDQQVGGLRVRGMLVGRGRGMLVGRGRELLFEHGERRAFACEYNKFAVECLHTHELRAIAACE